MSYFTGSTTVYFDADEQRRAALAIELQLAALAGDETRRQRTNAFLRSGLKGLRRQPHHELRQAYLEPDHEGTALLGVERVEYLEGPYA